MNSLFFEVPETNFSVQGEFPTRIETSKYFTESLIRGKAEFIY